MFPIMALWFLPWSQGKVEGFQLLVFLKIALLHMTALNEGTTHSIKNIITLNLIRNKARLLHNYCKISTWLLQDYLEITVWLLWDYCNITVKLAQDYCETRWLQNNYFKSANSPSVSEFVSDIWICRAPLRAKNIFLRNNISLNMTLHIWHIHNNTILTNPMFQYKSKFLTEMLTKMVTNMLTKITKIEKIDGWTKMDQDYCKIC